MYTENVYLLFVLTEKYNIMVYVTHSTLKKESS